jgi:DeoR/GlpR family transcriptional regulator of sugar metabolism
VEQTAIYTERQNRILTMLSRLQRINVQDLTRKLGVSEVTIRKDLSFLEERGKLVRVRGGARLAEDGKRLRTVDIRIGEQRAEKRAIAARALTLIREGENIFIDSGSTCACLAALLRDRELRVMTNSLDVLNELAGAPGIALLSTGGSFRPEARSFIGPTALANLKNCQIDTCFIGATGFTVEGIFTSQNTLESQLKSAVLRASGRRIVLADHTKFGRSAFSVFARARDIDVLITDAGLVEVEAFGRLGMELLRAEAEENQIKQ